MSNQLKPARERTVEDFAPRDKILFFRVVPEEMDQSAWYTGTVIARGAQGRVECHLDAAGPGFVMAYHVGLVPAEAIEIFRARPDALRDFLLDSFPLEYTMDKEQLEWVAADVDFMARSFLETFVHGTREPNRLNVAQKKAAP